MKSARNVRATSLLKGSFLSVIGIQGLVLTLLFFGQAGTTFAEYGDVVLNNTSKAANMNPVIFPHWLHRMKYSCRACHETLGFKMKAGTSGITMQKIFAGQFCGVCHNAKTAFGTFQCQFCHTGKKGLETQVHRSTKQTLVSPLE